MVIEARQKRSEVITLLKNLKKKINADRAILFGSYARGDIHDYSDIDVIFIKNTREKKKIKRLNIVYDNYSGPLPLDAIVYTPKEFEKMRKEGNIFLKQILKDGVAV